LFGQSIDTVLSELQRWQPSSSEEEAPERPGRTVVCLTTEGFGRRADALAEVSRRSGVHVIMATGGGGNASPSRHYDMDCCSLANEFERELIMGLQGLSSLEAKDRAGCLVAYVSKEMPLWQRNVLCGALEAQSRTGAPLYLVPTPRQGTSWEELTDVLELCETEGGDWSKIVLCGVVMTHTLKAKRDLLGRGATLCFEVGWSYAYADPAIPLPADEEIAREIHQLCREGSAKQLLLSQGVGLRSMWRSFGGVGYSHVQEDILPRLARLGVAEESIETITVANPVRLLAWWTPPPPKKQEIVTWTCSQCQKGFPDEQERYTKFEYQYCSLKCLRKHTKKMAHA